MSNFKDIAALCIEQIKTSLGECLKGKEKKPATQMTEAYLAKIQSRELVKTPVSEVRGEMMSLWRFIKKRAWGKTLVRAYNPSPEEHQWHSTHSIIEIVCDDQPFLVASILMELEKQDIQVYSLNHIVYEAKRNKQDVLLYLDKITNRDNKQLEFLMHIEIERQVDETALNEIEDSVWNVLNDVYRVYLDWKPMRSKMLEVAQLCKEKSKDEQPIPTKFSDEALKFLAWLSADKFLFIGYAYYSLKEKDGHHFFVYQEGSGLGLLGENRATTLQTVTPINPCQADHFKQSELLILTKSNLLSTIHRPGHLDHIGVKHYKDGKAVGEWRFCGLLSSLAYSVPINQMPLVRKKIKHVLEGSESVDAHRSRILEFVINQYPRDELLQADANYLKKTLHEIVRKQERRQMGVFLRTDSCDEFVTTMVYILKEHYTTELRTQFEQVLMDTFNGKSIDFNIVTTDHPLTQILFRIYCNHASEHEIDVDILEARMTDLMMRWQDRQQLALVEQFGEAEGKRLHRKYMRAFPAAYREDSHPLQGVMDIQTFENFGPDVSISTRLYYPADNPDQLHFRVLGSGQSLALSDVLPILEQMGVKVLSARPYSIAPKGLVHFWILDFAILPSTDCNLENKHLRELFQEVFVRIWKNDLENDSFNALVMTARIGWRRIMLIRALSRYLLQLQVPFSQQYMQETVNNNPAIARDIVELFFIRFDPTFEGNRDKAFIRLLQSTEAQLEEVTSLDEDRILRHFLSLIQAIYRTNFFQSDDAGLSKPYVSFKLSPQLLVAAPQPRLKYEIFVYSPRVEGVHMRAGKVARGGLRWSDRREDYRTEVLGLAKAQMVKNSVIVPLGAKGGFIAKQLPLQSDREALIAEGIACYEMFISGLLDVTDNMQGGKIVPPTSVVRHDEDDPYLVVAADKGTATFSDIANKVSNQYNFWLGDAFASGGSQGYDHKGMGITAKGAWESVKRLFWSKSINVQNEDFTVVGIGDMSGDVFGNGMLLSKHIRLVAAFNHMHIFLDPNPDIEKSYKERQRLFDMERSSWSDYKKSLISKGGGIYNRSQKSIKLTAEVKAMLGVNKNTIIPNDLIQAILCAPVDLLWNGGIGTYIKASTQTNEVVGDRSNDSLRVDAKEVRAVVIVEGGNLGLTQKARIEFARNGGLISTDAVDNSAGVDCSDHEVNIKILLDQAVAEGDMTEKQRNLLLATMTNDVSKLVLRNNYLQSMGLTLTTGRPERLINDQRRLINILEKEKRLSRKLEALPSDAELSKMSKNGESLTRPEISVLLAHTKLKLFGEFIEANIQDDDYLFSLLPCYFPEALQASMADRIIKHPLKIEILATHIINDICNRMGSCFIDRLQQETRCSSIDAIRAFIIVQEVFNLKSLWQGLEDNEYNIDPTLICNELISIRRHIEKSALWLLRRHNKSLHICNLVAAYSEGLNTLSIELPHYLSDEDQHKWKTRQTALIQAGMPKECARTCAGLYYLYFGFGIIDIAKNSQKAVAETARIYFALEGHLILHWLREQVRSLPEVDLWRRKARDTLRDKLDNTLSNNCACVLDSKVDEPKKALDQWLRIKSTQISRWHSTVKEVQASSEINLAMLSVAVQELSLLAEV